jgi:hypothetical protein
MNLKRRNQRQPNKKRVSVGKSESHVQSMITGIRSFPLLIYQRLINAEATERLGTLKSLGVTLKFSYLRVVLPVDRSHRRRVLSQEPGTMLKLMLCF